MADFCRPVKQFIFKIIVMNLFKMAVNRAAVVMVVVGDIVVVWVDMLVVVDMLVAVDMVVNIVL